MHLPAFYIFAERFAPMPLRAGDRPQGPASILVREQTVSPSLAAAVEFAKEFDTAFTVVKVDVQNGTSCDATVDVLKAVAAESFEQFQPLHYELAGLCDEYRVDHYTAPRSRADRWDEAADRLRMAAE